MSGVISPEQCCVKIAQPLSPLHSSTYVVCNLTRFSQFIFCTCILTVRLLPSNCRIYVFRALYFDLFPAETFFLLLSTFESRHFAINSELPEEPKIVIKIKNLQFWPKKAPDFARLFLNGAASEAGGY